MVIVEKLVWASCKFAERDFFEFFLIFRLAACSSSKQLVVPAYIKKTPMITLQLFNWLSPILDCGSLFATICLLRFAAHARTQQDLSGACIAIAYTN
jgi:hypothetical protein